MIIDSKKTKKDFTIYKCRYIGGYFNSCYVAKKGDYYAHGETIKQAIKDVNFKFLQETFDLDSLVSEIKEKQTVSINEYRLLTGACSSGVKNFMSNKNITKDELPLSEVLYITRNEYGGGKINELFNN